MILANDTRNKQEYYTTQEAIHKVGVSEATFLKDVRERGIRPFRQKGHKNYWPKEAIDQLAEERNRMRPVDND